MAEVVRAASLSREEKVAILISSLGEDLAQQVLESMSPANARKLADRLAAMGPLDKDTLEAVIREFIKFIGGREGEGKRPKEKGETSPQVEWASLDKDVAGESEGAEKLLTEETEKFFTDEGEKSLFHVLEYMEAKVLADFTKGEHPQTIALILAHLQPGKAGEVLSTLPEDLQADVVLRLAHLETVPSSAVKAVAEALQDQVQSVGAVEKKIGGIKLVANILNQTGRSHEKNILDRIEETDPELSDQIRQDLFTFDDLAKVDDRGIREILKEITSQALALALKAASEELKDKIFRNMSQRAAEMLREDIEALGPTRLSEVEKAQQEITRVALKLEADDKIAVSGRGKEEVFV